MLDADLNLLSQISTDSKYKAGTPKPDNYVKLIEFSNWNPCPQRRKLIGDYFYLRIITLEGLEFHATAFSKGFYVNKCTVASFDPSADSELFYSILELISFKSSSFKYVLCLTIGGSLSSACLSA